VLSSPSVRHAGGYDVDASRVQRHRADCVHPGSLRPNTFNIGLAGKPAAVWIHGGTLTIEHASEPLAAYGVELEADGRHPPAPPPATLLPTLARSASDEVKTRFDALPERLEQRHDEIRDVAPK
jgi:hypothetical protein